MGAATDLAEGRDGPILTDRRFLAGVTLLGILATALACWYLDAASRAGRFGPLTDALFVSPYWDDARQVASGLLPYRDFPLEYPPLSLPVFVLPWILPFGGADYASYRKGFEVVMTVIVMGFVPVVVATAWALRATRWQVVAAVVVVAASPLLLGPLMISRYDPWPALLTGVATLAAVLGRHRLGLAFLALGALAKIYPAFLVPVFLIYAWKRAGPREAAFALGTGVLVGLLGFAPFLAAGGDALLEPFLRTFSRPLQIESLGASVLIGLHAWLGLDPGHVIYTFLSFNLDGGLADAVSTLQSIALAGALVGLWLLTALGGASRRQLVVSAAAVLCTTVALGKVLSPQYVIWIVPAAAILAPAWGIRPLVVIAAILALTQVYYPGMYARYLLEFDATATLAILERNLAVAGLAVALVWATWRWAARPRRRPGPPPDPAPAGAGSAGPPWP